MRILPDEISPPSMVRKHILHMKADREHNATEMLYAVAPEIGKLARQLSLEESSFIIDQAYELVREFKQIHTHIAQLSSEREKHVKSVRHEHLRRILAEEETKKFTSNICDKKHVAHDKTKMRGLNHLLKHNKFPKQVLSREKKNVEIKGCKSMTNTSVLDSFEKYGIIHESDISNMRPEFVEWLFEVKNIHIDNLSKIDGQILFKEFVENFKTASMSSIKFYSLSGYNLPNHKNNISDNNNIIVEEKCSMIVDDETAKKKETEQRKKREAEDRVGLTLKELKHSGKASNMREQEILRQRLALAFKTGDKRTVELLMDRLKPIHD